MGLRATVLASVLSLFGCATLSGKTLVPPERGGSAWIEVASVHFVLKTDLDPAAARDASATLEEMFAALSGWGFPSQDKPKFRIDVVWFRSLPDFKALTSQMQTGRFYRAGLHDFEAQPIALVGGDFVQSTRETLQHELTHWFVHYYYPQAPRWLDEGLATYLETLAIEGGTVVIGRARQDRKFWRGPQQWRSDPRGGSVLLLPMSEAPELDALLRMDPQAFYGNLALDPTVGEGTRALAESNAHYQAAWTLVHMLLTSAEYTDAFGKYLQRLHGGERDAAAWNETLGQLPAAKLANDYQLALVPNEVVQIRDKWSPPAHRADSVRSMSSSEVHTLWARLRPDTPQGESDATRDLAEARSQMGSGAPRYDADLVLVETYRKAYAKQRDAAAQELRAATAAHPEDPRLWNALGWVMVQVGMEAKVRQGRSQFIKSLADIGVRLAPLATSARELHLLAIIEKEANERLDAALDCEKRAVAIDPSCSLCRSWAAVILYRQGFVREAIETATLALGLLEEGERDLRREAEVAQWRRELAAQSSEAPSPARPQAITGTMRPSVVEAVVRARFADIRNCHEEGRRRTPNLAGSVNAKFVIAPDGRVALVRDGGSSLRDRAVLECVFHVFEALHFPKPEGGRSVTVTYPIDLRP